MFDKILVPVDGSRASSRAVHVAADLASRYGAEVIVLHVHEHEYLYGVDAGP
jgi:nucleotide-binding universal stress UspA family protein